MTEETINTSNEVLKKKKNSIYKNWKIKLASIPVIIFILLGIFGPLIMNFYPLETYTDQRLLSPGTPLKDGSIAWLGTDQLGRNVLYQIIYGARISLLVSLATVFVGGSIGVALGLVSGYFGGIIDSIIMRIADIQLAFPAILLAILIAGVLGPSVTNIIITLSITRWVTFARVTRSATLSTKKRSFVDSAKALGASRLKILFKYILPMCVSSIMVIVTVQLGLVIISEASLSFLGLGVPSSQPSWGYLISLGRDYINSAWWIATMPGIALSILVVSVGYMGDKLRDVLDTSLE